MDDLHAHKIERIIELTELLPVDDLHLRNKAASLATITPGPAHALDADVVQEQRKQRSGRPFPYDTDRSPGPDIPSHGSELHTNDLCRRREQPHLRPTIIWNGPDHGLTRRP